MLFDNEKEESKISYVETSFDYHGISTALCYKQLNEENCNSFIPKRIYVLEMN